jgi:hypothetical protein
MEKLLDDISDARVNAEFLTESQVSLDCIFSLLCQEHPGAVPVRQSFERYRRCAELDIRRCTEGLHSAALSAHNDMRWRSMGVGVSSYNKEGQHGRVVASTLPAAATADSSAGTLCDACNTVIVGPFVKALGRTFHRACFVCYVSSS